MSASPPDAMFRALFGGRRYSRPTRRALLLLPAAACLTACQFAEVRVSIKVPAETEKVFLEAIRSFAELKGFRFDQQDFSQPGYRNIELWGWRTLVWISGAPAMGFVAHVRDRDELWLALLPKADLKVLANELKQAITSVDGVAVSDD